MSDTKFEPVKTPTVDNIVKAIEKGAEIAEGCEANGTKVTDLTPNQLKRCKGAYTKYVLTLKERMEKISKGDNPKGDMRAILEILKLRTNRKELLASMVESVLDALESVLPPEYYEVALKALKNLEV